MDNINDNLSELQSSVVHMRTNMKDSIVNREKQNLAMQVDVLKQTKVIPLHKIPNVTVPDLKTQKEYIDSSFKDVDLEVNIDIIDIKQKIKELKKVMKIVSNQKKCKIIQQLRLGKF